MLQRLHLEVLRVDVDEGADGAEFMVEVTKRTASSQRHLRQMGLSYTEGWRRRVRVGDGGGGLERREGRKGTAENTGEKESCGWDGWE